MYMYSVYVLIDITSGAESQDKYTRKLPRQATVSMDPSLGSGGIVHICNSQSYRDDDPDSSGVDAS